MATTLSELKEDWARKKERYESLLHEWFPPAEPGRPLPPLKTVPSEVMAQLEEMEREVEKARLAYVSALLYDPRP